MTARRGASPVRSSLCANEWLVPHEVPHQLLCPLSSYIPHVVPLVAPRWLDSMFTLLTASVLLFMGARHLFIDARSGVRWWGDARTVSG